MSRRRIRRPSDRPDVAPGAAVAPGIVRSMADRSHKIAKPAAAVGVLATMASIWWFALRPRRKDKRAE